MQASSGLSGTTVILGILSVALVAAVGFGFSIPVIGNGRAAFFLLAVMGMRLCGQALKDGFLPHNPVTWVGVIIGTFNLLLVGAVLFHVRVPLITTEREATLALGASMALKVGLALLRAALA